MIDSFHLKDCLSFDELDIEFDKGLVVFSGPSGAGKSIFFDAMLDCFAHKQSHAKLCEAVISDHDMKSESFLFDDEFIIKKIQNEKTRYFLNNQNISKKELQKITKNFVRSLDHKSNDEFTNKNLLLFLDKICSKNDSDFLSIKEQFETNFDNLSKKTQELKEIDQDEELLEEKKDFLQFEIEQISSCNPKIGEIEELKELKKRFISKEKIESSIKDTQIVFANFHKIDTMLSKMSVDGEFFAQTTQKLQSIVDEFESSFENLSDKEIEQTIDRIENLSKLEKKYGSLEEAIKQKEKKEIELEKLENISFEKAILQKNIKKLTLIVDDLCQELTAKRESSVKQFVFIIQNYLDKLYLGGLDLKIKPKLMDKTGANEIVLFLNNTKLEDISSGELNRVKLALLAGKAGYDITYKASLFLDEIDANLSGKESEALAILLKELSQHYQIFAISHHPQLSSMAHQHILVYKQNETSYIKELSYEQRVQEIARIVSGENITIEAKKLATKLLRQQ